MADGPVLALMALCEECFLIDHAHWVPESMDESGNATMRLAGVDMPENVSVGSVDVCCQCGSITIVGIYEYRDPTKIYFTTTGEAPQFEMGMQDFGEE